MPLKKILRWSSVVLGGLLLLLIIAMGGVYAVSESRFRKRYEVPVVPVTTAADAEAISRGQHVATVRACVDCHGANLAGRVMVDEPMLGRLVSTNLTSGRGGVGRNFSDEDFARAIRHGVGVDGKPLIVMPANEYKNLSDKDVGALIAYIRSVPPIDNNLPGTRVGPLLRALYVLTGDVNLVPAEDINHMASRPPPPEPGVTVAYGAYMATTCTGCHGSGFSGGPIPGAPPSWPPAANLTPGGPLADYSEADFLQTMRTGTSPSGKRLDAAYMPWPLLGQMTDAELKAVYLYLASLPAKETGNR